MEFEFNNGRALEIRGIEGFNRQTLEWEIQRGGRFVVYEYCFSVLVVTITQPSDIYFVRADENRSRKGLKYSMISLLCGWWAIPGLIRTPMALATNFGGGRDVTGEVMAQLAPPPAPRPNPNRWNWADGEVDGHYHHKLWVTRQQLRMGEVLSLTIADGSTFKVRLSPEMPEDAQLRLANAYRNGAGDVFVHIALLDP